MRYAHAPVCAPARRGSAKRGLTTHSTLPTLRMHLNNTPHRTRSQGCRDASFHRMLDSTKRLRKPKCNGKRQDDGSYGCECVFHVCECAKGCKEVHHTRLPTRTAAHTQSQRYNKHNCIHTRKHKQPHSRVYNRSSSRTGRGFVCVRVDACSPFTHGAVIVRASARVSRSMTVPSTSAHRTALAVVVTRAHKHTNIHTHTHTHTHTHARIHKTNKSTYNWYRCRRAVDMAHFIEEDEGDGWMDRGEWEGDWEGDDEGDVSEAAEADEGDDNKTDVTSSASSTRPSPPTSSPPPQAQTLQPKNRVYSYDLVRKPALFNGDQPRCPICHGGVTKKGRPPSAYMLEFPFVRFVRFHCRKRECNAKSYLFHSYVSPEQDVEESEKKEDEGVASSSSSSPSASSSHSHTSNKQLVKVKKPLARTASSSSSFGSSGSASVSGAGHDSFSDNQSVL